MIVSVTTIVVVQSADIGLLISGLLGAFLLLCTYLAIGLFISCLSSYQVVTGILTIAVLALLNVIGTLLQEIPIINEINYWLSIPERYDELTSGLLSSKVLAYFIIVILLFLVFSGLELYFKRQTKQWYLKLVGYSIPILTGVGLAYFTSLPGNIKYLDFTRTNRNTLTEESRAIVSKLQKKPVKIISYVNILSNTAQVSGLPRFHNRNFRQIEDYVRFLPQIEMDYIFFYDSIPGESRIYEENPGLTLVEIAEKYARSFGLDFDKVLSPGQVRQVVDLESEENRYVRMIETDSVTSILRLFSDNEHYPAESQTSASLKQLTDGPTNVQVVIGHGERSFSKDDRDFSYMNEGIRDRNSLRNNGFVFNQIDLGLQTMPFGNSILFLADPKSPLSELEIKKVIDYIDEGGDMILVCDPENRSNVQPILDFLSVSTLPGRLKQRNQEYQEDKIRGLLTDEAKFQIILFKEKNRHQLDYLKNRKVNVSMPGVMGLSHEENERFDVLPVVVTRDSTEVQTDNDTWTVLNESVPIMLALVGRQNEDQQIIVAGDADFLSNKEVKGRLAYSTGNSGLVGRMFSWLSEGRYPIGTGSRQFPRGGDDKLLVQPAQLKLLRIFMVFGIPSVLILLGGTILIKRRL